MPNWTGRPAISPDHPTLARLREQAAQARTLGRYAQAAEWEQQAVELTGALGLAGARMQALLWEGYSLRLAGKAELALAALLPVVNEAAPTADPADRFSALIAIVHISLERKPARFCRALLEQGRRDLGAWRQPWRALLDFLEGELAFRQGDFAAAWHWHQRAWAGRRETHPRLTPATHLWALCRTAFRRREPAELERLTRQLTELHPPSTLERQLVRRAQGLNWRAQRATAAKVTVEAAPVAAARVWLTGAGEEPEAHDFGARLEALRVLALASDWDRIDAALRHNPLRPDRFESALGLGDLAVSRARAALKRPAVDDDYGETAVGAAPLAGLDSARTALGEAENHYRDALRLAADQDRRLETGWYSDTVRRRLALLGSGHPPG